VEVAAHKAFFPNKDSGTNILLKPLLKK